MLFVRKIEQNRGFLLPVVTSVAFFVLAKPENNFSSFEFINFLFLLILMFFFSSIILMLIGSSFVFGVHSFKDFNNSKNYVFFFLASIFLLGVNMYFNRDYAYLFGVPSELIFLNFFSVLCGSIFVQLLKGRVSDDDR
mgnify:CR=1 FL=1